ncbi:AcrR family transcriptional regulator [Bifidobacterium sp. DSM 109957]|uniref:AcrR family transcriptional regulator n=2 Tax=Bifidobacterium oedipodis TaxID=2675322 RepID=A0A7Y0EP51_9BIFI|nr:AcrR family transcriptional regulator [Bifidobacterium sp. DSM 109957]
MKDGEGRTMAFEGTADTDRRAAILNAAVVSFGTLGYYGTSLQRIANEVGLTKAGVLHHVGSKEGLLDLVLGEMYDRETLDLTSSMVREERPLIAELWRRTVAINAERPQLVHMFSTLSAEALDPAHPAHDYFEARERDTVDMALNIRWHVPGGVDAERVLQAGFAMMDGIQLRWLRTPGQDLNAMWAECENVLFPLPLWEGYR